MVLNDGIWRVPNSMVSVTSFMLGSGGKMNSFWAMNSLRMSFCRVPRSFVMSAPCFSAAAMYMAQMMAAGELMVIEVEMSAKAMPSNRISMSSRLLIATPHTPTSPSDHSSSLSRPMSVGRSKATERPVWPRCRRNL